MLFFLLISYQMLFLGATFFFGMAIYGINGE